jgi:hypothetical protein
MLAMGVRSWPAFIGFYAAVTVFAIVCVMTWRAKRPGVAAPIALAVITMIANSISAMMFGPLVGTPSLAILATVSLVTQVDRHRWTIVLLGLAPMFVPLLFAPMPYAFTGDRMETTASMLKLSPVWSPTLLVVMNVTGVLAGAIIAGRLRDYAAKANRNLVVQAWQLRKLLPQQ